MPSAPQSRLASAGVDIARIEAAVTEILHAIGENPERAGLADTPSKIALAYTQFFSGIAVNPLDHLTETVPGGQDAELIIVRDIEFRSMCEHHLLPFLGVAHIAYAPADRVVGLGQLPRVVDTLASRPQLQERLTEEIAETLSEGLGAHGVLVVVDAVHGCVTSRGPRLVRSSTLTLASRGILADPRRRAEAMTLIGTPEDHS